MTGPATDSVVWWWLGLEGVVPPPIGAFADGPGYGGTVGGGWVGGRASDPALSCRPQVSVMVGLAAGAVMVMMPRWWLRW
ncbi:hypothetical protein BZL30_7628 [Mycobacterium kansasii]|uniref:Uncharacterized protein n=1 Tax=Mycobacterium kansasii TaxID=1768 RepID=A0A1V3WL79_MYCKA|nr:hypothetical protein BZL30_7628 [Mycobacterium kansasii]